MGHYFHGSKQHKKKKKVNHEITLFSIVFCLSVFLFVLIEKVIIFGPGLGTLV